MAHSIEILLDSDTEAVVRAQWDALEAAGLPSAGRVRARTNRPHCTLLAGTAVSPAVDAALVTTSQRLPFEFRVGGAVVFAAGRKYTLARAVVPSSELLAVHATVARLTGEDVTDLPAHCLPGQWTPHVTLGLRLTGDELAVALQLLSWPTVVGQASALRRWDGDAKTDVVFPGRAC
ncbi:2'-5' RNA ligase family protein [Gordonia neofelifaecis]|uniref:2'-5' RNA ligase family protein n=1 Tax=Gordonia neofelifaecis NRRL B-59395 TaxID=644548 RepID=F1YH39_9ACTN|nr:2'-5' RNA ligase family protein [Gordonia neofelifaecis]EGD55954.1 hypothetical protein SCNU_06930 [Gordonia neofelifaecis NRRL B-59395]